MRESLNTLLESSTVGDPVRVILWTTLSWRKIAEHLEKQGFKASHTLVASLLSEMGYSKQVNQKKFSSESLILIETRNFSSSIGSQKNFCLLVCL